MALHDAAVVTAARGYIYVAPEGTAAPTPAEVDAFNPAAGFASWDDLGHTSSEDLPEFGFDGGESEPRGTWRVDALRTVVTEAAVDYVTFRLLQFDEDALSLYYGQSNTSTTTGVFRVAGSGAAVRKALLIVVVDGSTSIAFYAPKCDVRREDAITLATDEFGAIPLRATFLQYLDTSVTPNQNVLFDWISNDTGVNPA
jgi:hypothetical protein